MTRIYIVLIGLSLGASILEAAVYKGQKIYIKKCRICHQGGEKVATRLSMKAWQDYFKNNGSNLLLAHSGNTQVKDQIDALHAKGKEMKLTPENLEHYFASTKFQKESRHLRDFMIQYAKDSGNVPACN